jgi:two-component system, cell cycle sensor histidine kinase PleC
MNTRVSELPLPPAEQPSPPVSLDIRLRVHQLGLSSAAIRDISITVPFWAFVMTVMLGGSIPDIGNTPRNSTWPSIVVCVVVTIATVALWKWIKTRAKSPNFDGRAGTAFVAIANFANAGAWSLVTYVFWQPENVANHSFLMVLTFGAVTLFLTSRSGSFLMVVSATTPVIVMLWAHLLQQAVLLDTVMACIIPFWAVQLHLDSWRACRAVTAAHRTRLEMEILAAELSRARDEAAHASQAKSLFLANMSHELRTPLNAIMGFSEIISTQALGPDAPDRYREYASDVFRSGRHLLSLINDLLDVAKIESGKLELECVELDGDTLLQECLGMIADRAREKGLALRSRVAPSGLSVYADARAFRQIAINLLSNAVKFTPAGGSVEAILAAAGEGIELRVRDTGCGIPASQLARIFEPFEQVDNHYGRANGGTGLGLTLVRALSELHGGTCRIASEQGKGTQVTIYLPPARTGAALNFAEIKAAAG